MEHPTDLTWQVLSILGLLLSLSVGVAQLLGRRGGRKAEPTPTPAEALSTHAGGYGEQLKAAWRRLDELRDKVHELELHVSESYVTHDDLREVKGMIAETNRTLNGLRTDFTRVFSRALSKFTPDGGTPDE